MLYATLIVSGWAVGCPFDFPEPDLSGA